MSAFAQAFLATRRLIEPFPFLVTFLAIASLPCDLRFLSQLGGKLQKNERLPFLHLRDAATVKLFSATSRAGDAEDELNEARYKNLNCGCRGQNLILKRTHGPAKVSQGRYRLQVFSCRLPVIVTEARGTWNLRLRRITWG